jgi:hypothetical protein
VELPRVFAITITYVQVTFNAQKFQSATVLVRAHRDDGGEVHHSIKNLNKWHAYLRQRLVWRAAWGKDK